MSAESKTNPLERFPTCLNQITVSSDQEIGPYVFFDNGKDVEKYEVLSKTKNWSGNWDIKIKFVEKQNKV